MDCGDVHCGVAEWFEDFLTMREGGESEDDEWYEEEDEEVVYNILVT